MTRRRRFDSDRGARAIDPASGFKVYVDDLVQQWDLERVDARFVDERNSQDFVRGIPDRQVVPNARPEPEDVYILVSLISEDGALLAHENGLRILAESSIIVTPESL